MVRFNIIHTYAQNIQQFFLQFLMFSTMSPLCATWLVHNTFLDWVMFDEYWNVEAPFFPTSGSSSLR